MARERQAPGVLALSLVDLRQFALARSLFPETTLERAVLRLGFVQADPIRAPARAQDLTLLQRVKNYRAGDLERRYEELGFEEDFFVNYGFLPRPFHALMHPRSGMARFSGSRARQAERILDFVRERGGVHPRDVEARFGSGTETNYWGGTSNTTTRILDGLHYRGLLRVARREAGIRIYAPAPARAARDRAEVPAAVDALVDLAVQKYAPLPRATLTSLVGRLRYAAPQWQSELAAALARAKQRLPTARVADQDWYWPEADLAPGSRRAKALAEDEERVRLLAPFDPLVWDRRRFTLFWDWAYRFEAYTPRARRKLGYYALPLLYRSHVIGWGNLSFSGERLSASFGYATGAAPRDPAFRRALEAELARFQRFLANTTVANIGTSSAKRRSTRPRRV